MTDDSEERWLDEKRIAEDQAIYNEYQKKANARRKYENSLPFWARQRHRLGRTFGSIFGNLFHWTKNTFSFIFHTIWATFLLLIFLPFVLLLWIPWTFIPWSRPHLWLEFRRGNRTVPRRERVEFRSGADDRAVQLVEAFAWPGKGIESQAPPGNRGRAFFKGRPWEIYELMRECWRTVHRQGLQIGGVVAGLVLILFQVEQIAHDYQSPAVVTFLEAFYGVNGSFTDSPGKILQEDDKQCGYIVGTGIANWAKSRENLVWYGFYHGFLIVLCLMLILEEIFNVRLGTFAPQWSRMGAGYTIVFLVAATLSTSPNYGIPGLSRLRYAVCVAIFLFGIYNILRTIIAGGNLTHHTYANMTYRNRRHPLRPWTEWEWQKSKRRQDFRQRRPGDEPRFTERMQSAIGDHCWQYQKVDREKLNYGERQSLRFKVYRKTAGEQAMEKGRACRKFWHGLPIEMPPPSKQDLEDWKAYSEFKRWKSFRGVHHWHPWKLPNHSTDPAEAKRVHRIRSEMWYERYCTYWFDLRRIGACALSIAAFALHIGLLIDFTATGHFMAYQDNYKQAAEAYKENGGPSDDLCQYYEGTHVPMFTQPGVGPFRGVMNNLFWVALWHVFILGMCVAVFLVSFSNNRVFGMHLPWPVTLIGPRLSSNGVGWTLGFISWATLQLSLFPSYPPIVQFIARWICYCCLVAWILYLAPNEPLGNNFVRDPFWNAMSERAFVHMDSKRFHRELHDFTTMADVI